MKRLWSVAGRMAAWPVSVVIVGAGLGGCTTLAPYSNASFNQPAPAADASALRHTFKVDGRRGNDRVLMFLALSGGGSRAAYLSAETMLALQTRLDADLLAEVDVVSSVSGGSLAGAYFVASRDRTMSNPRLIDRLRPLLDEPGPSGLSLDPEGRLTCQGPLPQAELDRIRRLLPSVDGDGDALAVEQLCLASVYPAWDGDEVRKAMSRNFLRYWFGNWFWPANVFRYWTSSFDRSDIMAQTLANNVFSRRGLFGGELTLSDLNPTRPYLLINATNATSRWLDEQTQDDFPFGSVFTFTDEDFRDRICSDAAAYSLPRAVMASSAFPLVFATMTLRDFRTQPPTPGAPCLDADAGPKQSRRYLHVFDGGNSDNLGLRSIKRTLLQLEVDGRLQAYDRIVVMLVDAFTEPSGAARADPDPRSLLSLVLDTNVSDAVDSLLQSNRNNLMAEFADGELFFERDCDLDGEGLRQLPRRLCEQLRSRPSERLAAPQQQAKHAVNDARVLNLKDRLVFFHFGFDDVIWRDADKVALRRQLDRIPTSFQISDEHTALLREAVATVIRPDHPCLKALTGLVQTAGAAAPEQIGRARTDCAKSDLGMGDPSRSRRPEGARR